MPAASVPDNPNCLVSLIWVTNASSEYSVTNPVASDNSLNASDKFLVVTFVLLVDLSIAAKLALTRSALAAPYPKFLDKFVDSLLAAKADFNKFSKLNDALSIFPPNTEKASPAAPSVIPNIFPKPILLF